MQATFLLGPAGSGKTHRCLEEIRGELKRSAEGPPLVLLAPKQATFQLERQLLADPSLAGYTRLHILSFERLAGFIFERAGRSVPRLLADEGRVMVLRALLERKRSELQVFRASARLPGFARQLSQLLREFHRYHLSATRLNTLADRLGGTDRLEAKLRDLALLSRAYHSWQDEQGWRDADQLLDLATSLLQMLPADSSEPGPLGAVWLDGFAQMTPQERQLLGAVMRLTGKATLAFCLDHEPTSADLQPHAAWFPAGDTYLRCRDEFAAIPGIRIRIEVLPRRAQSGRFSGCPELQHLEQAWTQPRNYSPPPSSSREETTGQTTLTDSLQLELSLGRQPSAPASAVGEDPGRSPSIRLVFCANPEAEATLAAREIRRFVRDENGRYRDIAVILRSLDGYHDVIRRVFARFEIPTFLDRRESVAHHPLAELTRYALRTVAFWWAHDDWFGALKTGLVEPDDEAIDRLENEALKRGWSGHVWHEPMRLSDVELGRWIERLRLRLMPPFQTLAGAMAEVHGRPTGTQLSATIRELWRALNVDRQLDRWRTAAANGSPEIQFRTDIHATVWDQMNAWLENLELAFPAESLPLGDWLPLVEAGLSQLSVGVVPPALDQVLVGTIDRSRNPDLRFALVLGLNEGVFPAVPPAPALLSHADRDRLESLGVTLGPNPRQQIGLERYYGYIACTRARQRLMLTCARRGADGNVLNPSSFVEEVSRLFPALVPEEFDGAADWQGAEHGSELIAPILRAQAAEPGSAVIPPELRDTIPACRRVSEKWEELMAARSAQELSPALAESLYGKELHTSISALEDFAACPFKFFAGRGLRAEERAGFDADPRERGSFQHELLKEFHRRVREGNRNWRDLSGAEAAALIRRAGEELLPRFREGLFVASPSRHYAARMLINGLERLIETLIGWMGQYRFDPVAVELGFGLPDSQLPAWRIELDERHALRLRGRIDRVDLCRLEPAGETLVAVIDYKSRARKTDRVRLHHGLELQLLAYLGALSELDGLSADLGIGRLVPAGVFYVNLKGTFGTAANRDAERDARSEVRRTGYQHRGRFDGGYLEQFDNRGQPKGDQFHYKKNSDGRFNARRSDALPAAGFRALLSQVRKFLRQHGQEIYRGRVTAEPYRLGTETACDVCLYRPVCRFDPWIQPFRVLRPPPRMAETASRKRDESAG